MSFTLDYEQTKRWMRSRWPQAVHHGVFDDAFNDTFCDYLELMEDIPSNIKHLTWLANRMWNNVKRYEPFSLRAKAQNGKYNAPLILHGFFDRFELDGAEDIEKQVMMEEEVRKHYEDMYPANSPYPEVVSLLRQGYSSGEAADYLGCTRQWIDIVKKRVLE